MTDATTIISSARLGWQLLAKVPLLAGWLLRRVFPANKCNDRFLVDVPGTHARFELLSTRPSPALTALRLPIVNRARATPMQIYLNPRAFPLQSSNPFRLLVGKANFGQRYTCIASSGNAMLRIQHCIQQIYAVDS